MVGRKKVAPKPLPGFERKGTLTVEGWTILQTLVREGKNNTEIGRLLNMHKTSVAYWKGRPFERRAGSPNTERVAVKEKRVKLVKKILAKKDSRGMPKHNSVAAVRKELAESHGIHVSRSTAYYDAKESGYHARKRGKQCNQKGMGGD